jgi:predicted MFS family arabinose efflux permease
LEPVVVSSVETEGKQPGVLATLRSTPASARYLLGGIFIVQAGSLMQAFIVLYLVQRGFSVGHAAAALTAYSIGATVGNLLGGELTHRIGPRVTVAGTMACCAVLVAAVPVLSRPALFLYLIVTVALAGLVAQCYRPAAATLLSEVMPEEHHVMSFSMMRVAMNTGATVGPLIAAGLILVNWDLLFVLNAVTALLYAALAYFLLPAGRPAHDPEKAVEGQRSAYLVLLRDVRYQLYLLSGVISAAVYVQFLSVLPLKITSEGGPTALYSVVLAQSSLILILTEMKITTYTRRWSPRLVVAAGSLLLGLGIAAYAPATGSGVTIILGTFVFVLGVMVSGPTAFAYPAKFPPHLRARYLGAKYATFGLGLALGPAVGVLVWQAVGSRSFLYFGAATIVAAACALVGMRDDAQRRVPAQAGTAPDARLADEARPAADARPGS